MLTFFCISISLIAVWFIGFPIAVLLNTEDKSQERVWIFAPFLGLAAIILVLQHLIYLDIPIAKSFYWVWLGAASLWLIFFKRIKNFFPPPYLLLTVAIAIYLLHSLGLLIVGPKDYIGRGWYDQMSYAFLAQFLMDHPFAHAHVNDFLLQPYAIKALVFSMTNRLGEVIYQGFIACSTFTDAKTSFELSILILPPLIVFAVYQIAKRFSLSSKLSLLVAAVAGALPSLACIHLESFLSQALIIPLLLLWPFVLEHTFENLHWKKIIVITLLLALIISVYTEYSLIFIGLSFAYLIFQKKNFFQYCSILLAIICLAWMLNFEFMQKSIMLALRGVGSRSWSNIYPWANSIVGIDRLWLGDWTLLLIGWRKYLLDSVSIAFFIFAYVGFSLAVLKNKKNNAFQLTLLILMVLPLMIYLISIKNFGYQFYKLLISVSPLFPLGLVLAFKYLKINYYYLWLGFFITVNATLTMILTSANPATLAYFKRGPGYKLLAPETREIENKLNQISGETVLIAWQDDFRQGDFINGWLSYFARSNHVWLTNYSVGDENLKNYLPSTKLLPSRYLMVTSQNVANPKMKKIWENKAYILWKSDYILN